MKSAYTILKSNRDFRETNVRVRFAPLTALMEWLCHGKR